LSPGGGYICDDPKLETCRLPENINDPQIKGETLKAVEICPESDRCSKPDGTYLCCPYKNGTCCGVHGYCCPGGKYICDDPKLETCRLPEASETVEPVKVQGAKFSRASSNFLKMFEKKQSVKCDDGIHYCPDAYTCCNKNQENKLYGCCPVENAVCCGDGINW
jgi:hypothetical protein